MHQSRLHTVLAHKRVVEDLRRSEDKFLTILSEIGDPYFEADLAGTMTYVNQAFCDHVQFPADEIVGRHYRHFTDPNYLRHTFEIFHGVYETGQPHKNIEYHFRQKGGTIRVAEGSIALIRDPAGQPVGFRGILRDITDRLALAAALRKAKEVAEAELEIGRQIQSGFLPSELPQPPGWEITGCFRPAREVAGDFYDVFPLAAGKLIGLVTADVCGKGVGAALFMALVRSLIRTYADKNFTPKGSSRVPRDIWKALAVDDVRGAEEPALSSRFLKDAVVRTVTDTSNYIARTHRQAYMFATLFFGVLDETTGMLTYTNAGHDPPVLIGPGGSLDRLPPTGPAVGLLPDLEFGIEQVILEPQATLITYTDGATDARGPDGVFFGEARLLALLDHETPSAAVLLAHVEQALQAHISTSNQFDDITMLAVRHAPPPAQDAPAAEPAGPVRRTLRTRATLENLPQIREFVLATCAEAAAGKELTFAFKLATEEICTNIVMYSYDGPQPGDIALTFTIDSAQIMATIVDHGRPFDTATVAVPDVQAPADERAIGGLGLFFVQELMDQATYEAGTPVGNRWTLVKRRPAPPAPQ